MAGTYYSLLYHVVFSTKDRRPISRKDLLPRLHEYPGGTVHGLDGVPLGVGGVDDHVHLLISLKTTHRERSFRDELIDFLKKSGVLFEERFLD